MYCVSYYPELLTLVVRHSAMFYYKLQPTSVTSAASMAATATAASIAVPTAVVTQAVVTAAATASTAFWHVSSPFGPEVRTSTSDELMVYLKSLLCLLCFLRFAHFCMSCADTHSLRYICSLYSSHQVQYDVNHMTHECYSDLLIFVVEPSTNDMLVGCRVFCYALMYMTSCFWDLPLSP